MDAFVARVALLPKAEKPKDDKRSALLASQGWAVTDPAPNMRCATFDATTVAKNDAFIAVGIARLNNAQDLCLTHNIPAETSNLELLLTLRTRLGITFVDHVSGAFSVVFYNVSNGTAEAYRDHFGVYPFYYSWADGVLCCGSDLRTTLHVSGLPLKMDVQRVADFIVGREIDREITGFSDLKRLPPAHQIVAAPTDLATTAYWTLEASEAPEMAQVPTALFELLETATNASLGPEKPVGAMMSGGLDSSTLCGLASKRLKELEHPPLKTLSFVYEKDKSFNETEYIEAGNEKFGTDPHYIEITETIRLDQISDVIEEQFDLFVAPGLIKSRQIYTVAKEQGLSALIDGHGGDECISHGFARIFELAAQGRLIDLWVNTRGVARLNGTPFLGQFLFLAARYGPMKPKNPFRRIILRLARELLKRYPNQQNMLPETHVFAADLRSKVQGADRYAPAQILKTADDFKKAETLKHIETLEGPLNAHAFEVLHRSAAAAGIEPRYPFFDKELIEFCVSVPSEAKLQNGLTRWMLRKSMDDILPEKICWRTDKADFSDEIQRAVSRYYSDPQRANFDDIASVIDTEQASRVLARVQQNSEPHPFEIMLLFRFVILRFWMQAFETWTLKQQQGTLIA